MSQKGEIQGFLASLGDFNVLSGKYLRGREARDAGVMILKVVPMDVVLAPQPSMLERRELPGIVGLIFHGLELTFAHGIVV